MSRRNKPSAKRLILVAPDGPPAGTRPWDRLPDEPNNAYVAFSVYRDLTSPRTVAEAWRIFNKGGTAGGQSRHHLAPPGTKPGPTPPVSGSWKRWPTVFRWSERAAAYDDFLEAEKRAAVAQARDQQNRARLEQDKIRDDLVTLALRVQDEATREQFDAGRLMHRQGLYLLTAPARTEQVAAPDHPGGPALITYTATDPRSIVAGARLILMAAELLEGAHRRAMALAGMRAQETAPAMESPDREAVFDAVQARYEEWRQQQIQSRSRLSLMSYGSYGS